MMEETPTYKPIIINSVEFPKPKKANIFDWISYYIWNLYRKPLVWKKQKELVEIFNTIKFALEKEVLPELWQNKIDCIDCFNAYLSLKPQVFLSQIQAVLTQMKCDEHPTVFIQFLLKYRGEFKRSEDLSKWINGFSK